MIEYTSIPRPPFVRADRRHRQRTRRSSTWRAAEYATQAESTANLLVGLLDADASFISYVAEWSQSGRSVLTVAATNVLHAVNAIAIGVGLGSAHGANEAEEISAA